MFERDKNELRDLGIPLEVGRVSALDPTEGYRINRDAYSLPPVELTPDEAAAVAVATQLWESPELITATQGALLKLRAAGVDVDPDAQVAIASPAGGAGSARVGGRSRNPVVGHRFPAGGAVPAPAVAGRAVHHTHRRAVGRGHREGPLVSGRPRPRPRRHPHLPAVADRCRGHADRRRPARSPCPTASTCARSSPRRSPRTPTGGCRPGYGSPTGGPPRCGAPDGRPARGNSPGATAT